MLTIIKSLGCRKKPGVKKAQSWALVECSFCKQQLERLRSSVSKSKNPSCGCAKSQLCAEAKTTHGHKVGYRKKGYVSSLYRRWCHIKERCDNPNTENYKYYGGKGVKLHESWRSFEVFRDWALANGYQEHLEIDRKESTGNYCPDNCRWVTKLVQKRNTVRVKLSVEKAIEIRILHNAGVKVKELKAKFGVGEGTIRDVLRGATWTHDADGIPLSLVRAAIC